MRLPRLTIGRLMIAVAVAGALLWASLMARRRAAYSVMAEDNARGGALLEKAAAHLRDLPEDADHLRRLADYHRRIGDKYRRAARRPWLPVLPDPPAPE